MYLYWFYLRTIFLYALQPRRLQFPFLQRNLSQKYAQILEKIQAHGFHYYPHSSLAAASAAAGAAARRLRSESCYLPQPLEFCWWHISSPVLATEPVVCAAVQQKKNIRPWTETTHHRDGHPGLPWRRRIFFLWRWRTYEFVFIHN